MKGIGEMPKVRTWSAEELPGATLEEKLGHMPPNVETIPSKVMSVGIDVWWGRDSGHIMVGSSYGDSDDGSRAILAWVNSWLFGLEKPLIELTDEEFDDIPALEVGGFMGFVSTLDRDGVNHLIRTLRKARDAAFGKDE